MLAAIKEQVNIHMGRKNSIHLNFVKCSVTSQFSLFLTFRATFLLDIHIIYGVKYTFSETT